MFAHLIGHWMRLPKEVLLLEAGNVLPAKGIQSLHHHMPIWMSSRGGCERCEVTSAVPTPIGAGLKARLRPDPGLAVELNGIGDDPEDSMLHRTLRLGGFPVF
ncbi:hypothetical protein GCM10027403_23200 [Arthrobacter tecti]